MDEKRRHSSVMLTVVLHAAYLLASNQTAMAGGWKEIELFETLRGMRERNATAFEASGFTPTDFQSYEKRYVKFMARNDVPSDSPEFGEGAADGIRIVACPHCGKDVPT